MVTCSHTYEFAKSPGGWILGLRDVDLVNRSRDGDHDGHGTLRPEQRLYTASLDNLRCYLYRLDHLPDAAVNGVLQ